MKKALSYDDITLVPQFSSIRSRDEADTSIKLGKFNLKVPIISANMDTITEDVMAVSLYKLGAVGALHRFMSIEQNVKQYSNVVENGCDCWVSIGVKHPEWIERFAALYDVGARNFVVDVAHGHSVLVKETVEKIHKNWSNITVMAGNISTYEAAKDLISWGVHILKVGIGPGSCCKTRVVTGHGVPMFTSIMDCFLAVDESKKDVAIVADGGIRSSGDIVKALTAGANAVMIGSLFAGTKETPGHVETSSSGKYKKFRGMASTEARLEHKMSTCSAEEGVSSVVPYKGKVEVILNELKMGIKSGMSYCNARTINEIYSHAQWCEQTHSGFIEGTPHIFGVK